MKKNKNGFTLFELLISISIIGILVAVVSSNFSAAQKKARDARRMEDMNNIQKAAEQYYSINSYNYPITWTSGGAWTVSGQTVLESFPMDPKGIAYTLPPSTNTVSAYCMCASMEGNNGNSTNRSCDFVSAGTKDWYCIKNQQ